MKEPAKGRVRVRARRRRQDAPSLAEQPASRRKRSFWRRPPPRFDLSHLRPASLPKGKRFETCQDVNEAADRTMERLGRIPGRWSRSLRKRLAPCKEGCRCSEPICPRCARLYRRWFTGEGLRLVDQDARPAVVVTVLIQLLDDAAPGLRQVKDHLRKRFRRAGITDGLAFGGFELGYQPKFGGLILHAHICIVGASDAAIAKLRASFDRSRIKAAFDCRQLRDRIRQLSYLLKIVSYFRPGQQSGPRKPRAVPMPNRVFADWAKWISDYRFEDLTFLYGLRRVRRRIRPI